MLSPGRQELSSSKFLGVPSAITIPNMHWVHALSWESLVVFFFKYFHRFQIFSASKGGPLLDQIHFLNRERPVAQTARSQPEKGRGANSG